MKKMVFTILILAAFGMPAGGGEKSKTPATGAETAVTKMARDYEQAFNKGDAKALGEMFAEDVEYTDEDGVLISGRDAVAALLRENFARNPGAKMAIDVQSIKSPIPNVAIERGATVTTSRDGSQMSSAYTAIHVCKDGIWRIQQLVESPAPAPSPGEMLSELGWMVGNWTEKDGDATVQTKVNWAQGGNFLTRNFTVTIGDQVTMQGWQIIGWDAANNTIRSWLFDNEGAFQEGTWTRTGNNWTIKQTGTLPDGGSVASENILQKLDNNRCTWEATNRTLDGDPQPNLPRVEMVRAKGK